MAEKETQVGLSPPSPEERQRLVVAFRRIQNAALRDEIVNLVEVMSRIDRYSESPNNFSTRPWRKVKTITSSVRVRFWVEAGLAALCGFLAILTLFSRDWIEALTGFDPDNHDGSFEWGIVAALFLVCILFSIAARADWRRLSSPAHVGI
jgi:hypothetical protein